MPDLVTLLTTDDAEPVTLSSTEVEVWWLEAAGDTYPGRQGLQVVLDVIKESGADDGQFAFRPSGWEVRLSRSAAQSLLTSAILGGVLAVVGADQLPAAVLAAAVPLLFDIQKVRLSGGEHYLLARLRAVPGATGSTTTAEELHALLPEELRDQTSLVDFMEFLDACHRAGQADVNADGSVLLHALADRKFRINFR
ncbi:hypothetical protein I0C86_02870 [Plantactinospora sp. S1510]|uniref:Uncharacterized protein n=1 Tax=Plantactinospora alkalitolerans TaxID=2789879 RepID=A0ABS0GPK6_9ACTN|nr:hypothetical protein [Plantactinospora alkalitolerans]MBF9127944.1 hypothetical protein [Plantactinospora alkalitolerans]